jgi:glycosyltransferase involved in cell wall biosynthesis
VAGSQGVERMRALGIPPSRVEVALQSADLEGLGGAAQGRRVHPPGGPVRVLAVGRLVADKNLDVLIEAFAEAGFGDGEAVLEIRGTGPLEPELRALAWRMGVPLELPGAVEPGQLGDVYANADLLALVSNYEPFGVTLREGAAAGLPLIASRRAGAVGDVAVDGENAIVIEPESRTAIAEALGRLVRDRDLRERLAAGSLAVTARHPQHADVEAWERAILRVATG